MPTMRAKLKISDIKVYCNDTDEPRSESLKFAAVCKSDGYPPDGSDENNTFARWTPTADLSMYINNPELLGKFKVGEEFYVDFTKAN